MDDQMLDYPNNRVVGVAADRDILESAYGALRGAGVEESRIDVLCARDVEPGDTAEEDGVIATVIRTVRTSLGEEALRLRALNEALDRGQYVIEVEMPETDGEVSDDDKHAVGTVLHEAGVADVAFYGTLTVEELQLGA